jgi:hypothetical protein
MPLWACGEQAPSPTHAPILPALALHVLARGRRWRALRPRPDGLAAEGDPVKPTQRGGCSHQHRGHPGLQCLHAAHATLPTLYPKQRPWNCMRGDAAIACAVCAQPIRPAQATCGCRGQVCGGVAANRGAKQDGPCRRRTFFLGRRVGGHGVAAQKVKHAGVGHAHQCRGNKNGRPHKTRWPLGKHLRNGWLPCGPFPVPPPLEPPVPAPPGLRGERTCCMHAEDACAVACSARWEFSVVCTDWRVPFGCGCVILPLPLARRACTRGIVRP